MFSLDSMAISMRKAREKRNLSKRALAKLANVPYATLCNAENALHAPSVFTLVSLARALRISIDDYIGFAP